MTAAVDPPEPPARGPRLFASPADEPRARRASDIVVLVASLFGLFVLMEIEAPLPGFVRSLVGLIDDLPDVLDTLWQLLAELLVLSAVLVATATVWRRRWTVGRDLLLAVLVGAVVGLLAHRVATGDWEAWHGLGRAAPPPYDPAMRIALPAAVLITASPHVALPVRRLGRWVVALGCLAVTLLGATSPIGAVAGLLVATIAAAIVHLTFGSSGGRPGIGLVHAALTELGVPVTSLGAADRQSAGYFLVDATEASGDDLVVKVYGRDAYDAALVSTLWRTVWYREAGSPLRFGRIQQVEHEAFLTLFAGQQGVRTDAVVTAGSTADDDALLVLRRRGRSLAEALGSGDLGTPDDRDRIVEQLWALLGQLAAAGLAHGQIDDRHLLVDGERLGIVDFRGSTVAPSETQRRTDQVQTFVATALLAGADRAVATAVEALGPDGVRSTLPYLQLPALTPTQRQRVRGDEIDLDELRAGAATAAGTDPPELIPLRRITLGSIVRVVLPAIALTWVISGLAGLDFAELLDNLRNAAWWLIVVGFIVAQLPRLSQSVSTLGAAPVPLPLGPVYALQLSTSYINVAVPATAARIGLNIRFFQRHGVPPGAAVACGALDSFVGFIVEISMLIVVLLFTPASLDLDVGSSLDTAWSILLVAVIVAVAGLVVIVVVGRLRRFVLHWVKRLAERGEQRPARVALAAATVPPVRGQHRHRDPLLQRPRRVRRRARLPGATDRAAAREHHRRPVLRADADPRRDRRGGGGADVRARAVRRPGGGGVRRRAPLPPGDVLPAPDLGLLRLPLARAQQAPVATRPAAPSARLTAMLRTVARATVAVLANAVGLIVATWILDDMTLSVGAFFVDVLIFTGVQVLAQPLIMKSAMKGNDALDGRLGAGVRVRRAGGDEPGVGRHADQWVHHVAPGHRDRLGRGAAGHHGAAAGGLQEDPARRQGALNSPVVTVRPPSLRARPAPTPPGVPHVRPSRTRPPESQTSTRVAHVHPSRTRAEPHASDSPERHRLGPSPGRPRTRRPRGGTAPATRTRRGRCRRARSSCRRASGSARRGSASRWGRPRGTR